MKREAGVNPAQGRCCVRPEIETVMPLWDHPVGRRLEIVKSRKPEDLPFRVEFSPPEPGDWTGRSLSLRVCVQGLLVHPDPVAFIHPDR
jgi:hypothetical protein